MPAPRADLVDVVTALPGGAAPVLARVRDWPQLVDDAAAHGLAGVLLKAVRDSRVAIPDDARRGLEEWLELERLRQDALRESTAHALVALDAAGIRAVSLKGIALGERLHGELGIRPTTDIDLLVNDADCDSAIAALETVGWHWERSPTERYYRRHHHHVHLEGRGLPTIELHFRAVVGFGAWLPAEDFVACSVPFESSAGLTRVLAPEDEVLYLAVHAAGHFLTRLGWLYDIKLLCERHPDLRWEQIVEQARSRGLARATAFTLRAARSIGASVPAAATDTLGARGKLARHTVGLAQARLSPLAQLGALASSALLGDTNAASLRHVFQSTSRIARRRAQRYLPQLFPEEWAA